VSLILDALNRSRQDRDSVPNLATRHTFDKMASGKRQYLPWVAFSVAVVIIGWLMIERLFATPVSDIEVGAPTEQVSKNIITASESNSTEVKEDAAVEEPLVQPVADSQTSEPVAVAPVANNPEPDIVTIAVAMEATTSISAPVVENPAVAQLYQNRNVMDDAAAPQRTSSAALDLYADSGNEEPIDIARVLQSAREEMKDATLDEHPVPLLSALSQQVKDDIPTLYYQRHDYSNNTSISTVVMNSKTLKVGGNPVNGVKIEEILPDSVVLSYQGTQFRLRALNSWVNL
jgi:general secretion pathway protein B|tara:strand:- start:63 stop:929 length:867 start_codon:yes stop_codon:yes gene_type:complete